MLPFRRHKDAATANERFVKAIEACGKTSQQLVCDALFSTCPFDEWADIVLEPYHVRSELRSDPPGQEKNDGRMNSLPGFGGYFLSKNQLMTRIERYSKLPWNHDLWSLVRYFRSLRLTGGKLTKWLDTLRIDACLPAQTKKFPIDPQLVELLGNYIHDSSALLKTSLMALRTEEEALAFSKKKKFAVSSTKTRNLSHHQSSKALIATVSGIARKACADAGVGVDLDPQRRAIWFSEHGLHVSARNLDGAVPSLENPTAVWEIKEYWGKTSGGSKMSDAVYECQLVGLELRMFELKSGISIDHIVFVDGKDRWNCRKSDLLRFIDLHQQGLIDHLVIGREVESEWPILATAIASR